MQPGLLEEAHKIVGEFVEHDSHVAIGYVTPAANLAGWPQRSGGHAQRIDWLSAFVYPASRAKIEVIIRTTPSHVSAEPKP